jgi:acyl carrier protein
VIGYVFTSDGEGMTRQSEEGRGRFMAEALQDAEVSPKDVDWARDVQLRGSSSDRGKERQILTATGPVRKENTVENVEEKVKSVLLEILDVKPEAIVSSAAFIDDLDATSIDIVEILTALQNTFDVNISDEEAQNIQTVQDAVNFLKAATAKKDAQA